MTPRESWRSSVAQEVDQQAGLGAFALADLDRALADPEAEADRFGLAAVDAEGAAEPRRPAGLGASRTGGSAGPPTLPPSVIHLASRALYQPSGTPSLLSSVSKSSSAGGGGGTISSSWALTVRQPIPPAQREDTRRPTAGIEPASSQ